MSDRPERQMVYRYTGAHPHLATMVAYDADEMDSYADAMEAEVASLRKSDRWHELYQDFIYMTDPTAHDDACAFADRKMKEDHDED